MKIVESQELVGVVKKESTLRQYEEGSGLIALIDNNGEKRSEQTYPFALEDAISQWNGLYPGDVVQFKISKEVRSDRRFATEIKLVKPSPELRRKGIVVSRKETFGFIRTEEAEGEVYFNIKDLDIKPLVNGNQGLSDNNLAEDLFEGDEVEFTLIKRPLKICAVRLIKLPVGSTAVPEFGTISTISSDKKTGKISVNSDRLPLPCIFEPQDNFEIGDEVSYILTKSGESRAVMGIKLTFKKNRARKIFARSDSNCLESRVLRTPRIAEQGSKGFKPIYFEEALRFFEASKNVKQK